MAGRSSIDIGSKDWVMTEHGRQIDILTHTQEKKPFSVSVGGGVGSKKEE